MNTPPPPFPPPGKMGAILTDQHLDTRIKICTLINVIVSKFVKPLETVQMTAAKK